MSRGVLGFVAFWVALAAWAAYEFFGTNATGHPLWHWLLVLVIGPPAVILFEFIGEGIGELFHRLPGIRHGDAYVERKARGQSLSGLRVAWGLVLCALALAGLAGIAWAVRTLS